MMVEKGNKKRRCKCCKKVAARKGLIRDDKPRKREVPRRVLDSHYLFKGTGGALICPTGGGSFNGCCMARKKIPP